MEKMRHPVTGHPRYMAFMEFAYTLKYLGLVSVRGVVRLTGGVFDAVED
jgi:hypothetical protein